MNQDEAVSKLAHQTSLPAASDMREANLKFYDRVLATVSALGLIMGGVWAVFMFSEVKRREIEQKADEAKKTIELREKDFLLRKHELNLLIFKERKEAYYALCDAACEIAACRDRKEVVERSHNFLRLYNGRAHIIAEADPMVSEKKIEFKRRLMRYLEGEDKESTSSPFTYFGTEAFQLTLACRKNVDPRMLENYAP